MFLLWLNDQRGICTQRCPIAYSSQPNPTQPDVSKHAGKAGELVMDFIIGGLKHVQIWHWGASWAYRGLEA